MRRFAIFFMMLVLSWPVFAVDMIPDPAPLPLPKPVEMKTEPLVIVTGEGQHRFWAEIAETPQQKEQGLMNRTSLEPNAAMIFLFDPPQEVSMWMKNTLIPLDMVFVNDKHKIFRMREAKPNDLTPLPSLGKAAAVIELPSGTIKKFNIRLGHRVISPALKPFKTQGLEQP